MEILINSETENLMKDQYAFMLLFKIAYFTKRNDNFTIPFVEIGEAFISNTMFPEFSPTNYRSAVKRLSNWGFATFRTTNRGTIAKLTTDKFFKI